MQRCRAGDLRGIDVEGHALVAPRCGAVGDEVRLLRLRGGEEVPLVGRRPEPINRDCSRRPLFVCVETDVLVTPGLRLVSDQILLLRLRDREEVDGLL